MWRVVVLLFFCRSEFSDFLKNKYAAKVILKWLCNGFNMGDVRLPREFVQVELLWKMGQLLGQKVPTGMASPGKKKASSNRNSHQKMRDGSSLFLIFWKVFANRITLKRIFRCSVGLRIGLGKQGARCLEWKIYGGVILRYWPYEGVQASFPARAWEWVLPCTLHPGDLTCLTVVCPVAKKKLLTDWPHRNEPSWVTTLNSWMGLGEVDPSLYFL